VIMPPALRKFVLAVHLTVSIGWIGAVAGYIALDIGSAVSEDAGMLRVAYRSHTASTSCPSTCPRPG
jgi:hypothetical protein